jgi:outer membrane protein assembly factor BamA
VARQIYLRLVAAILASLMPPFIAHLHSQECDGLAPRSLETAQQIKIKIASVEFPASNALPDEIRARLIRSVEQKEFSVTPDTPDSDWLNELNEVDVRDVLVNAGYFKAQTLSVPYLIRAGARQRFYAVRIEVESGLQYRLAGVEFANVTVFPQDELRKQLRLTVGQPFNVAKVRETLESITGLYSTKGYIDATVEPQINVDDEKQQIGLTLKLSEGAQYRVRAVEIDGVNDEAKNRLVDGLEPGHVFDASVLKSFGEQNERAVKIRRNTRDRVVDIVLSDRETGCTESAMQ